MSTHAIITLRMNGIDKRTYVHSDGYFEGLGEYLLDFVKEEYKMDRLRKVFPKISMVQEEDYPTAQQIIDMGKFDMPIYTYGGDKYACAGT